MLGVAADIYAGLWDGSKYKDSGTPNTKPLTQGTAPKSQTVGDPKQVPGSNDWILDKVFFLNINDQDFLGYLNKELHIPIESNLKDTLMKSKISDEQRQIIAQVIARKESKTKQEAK